MSQRVFVAGVGMIPFRTQDLDVCELHDCFAHNELISYEALGLCPEGGAAVVTLYGAT